MPESFDAIVIGSGIGGLTTASLLAQVAKKRVLVLERHFKLGGLTHSFGRKGFHWDVGLHYVGGMAPGHMSRQFMDLVTGHQVQWRPIEDPFEHFIYPRHHVRVVSHADQYRNHLQELFPKSAAQIDRYFQRVQSTASWMGRWFASKQMPQVLGKLLLWAGGRDAQRTTRDVLAETIDDPELRGILASQWGDYGLPPAQSSFGIHALIVKDYLNGGWVPVGGAQQLAQAIVPIIEAAGGKCLTGHEVERLEVVRGRVTQVIATRKKSQVTFAAPLVISNAGAAKTFNEFIDPQVLVPERDRLVDPVAPPTAVTVYLGLRESPQRCGMQAGNYWIATDYDHDAMTAQRGRLVDGQVAHCFLSSASLRSPEETRHNAQIICFGQYEDWQAWREQPWLNRDDDYKQIKERIAQSAIALVSRHLPGFAELVEYHEVSTPLTVESMMGHRRGAIYGLPATPHRVQQRLFHAQTSIKNLLLTGSDVGSVGIVGALMGGVMTAAWTLGPAGFLKLLMAARRASRATAAQL